MSLKLKVKLGRISGVVHTCEWCKYSTRSLNLFETHLNKCSPSVSTTVAVANNKKLQPKKKKKFFQKCDSCDFTAGMIKEMTRHKAKHHGLKVIPCKECDYLARNRSKLNRHIGYRHNKNKTNLNDPGNSKLSCLAEGSSLLLSTSMDSGQIFGMRTPTKAANDFNNVSSVLNDYELSNQYDFKLSKYYEEIVTSDSFDKSPETKTLACKFCGCAATNEEQILNHLQNFHLPNHCIEHEIQTTVVAGKRKSCEISLYKCTNCNFYSEQKVAIVGHVIDYHPSCLISVQSERISDDLASTSFISECSPRMETEKTYAYSCSDCLYRTNFKRNLKLHRTHHGADAPFRCTQCNFAAFHEIAISRHRNNYHIASVEKSVNFLSMSSEEHAFACHTESIKEEPTTEMETKTLPGDTNSEELALKCPVCPYVAKSRKYLRVHMQKRKHGRSRSGGVVLNQNSNLSNNTNNLDATTKPKLEIGEDGECNSFIETEDKPVFKCEHCPVTFNTYQAIAVHTAKAHKNEVVYKCHDCSFSSNRKYLLRNHQLVCPESSNNQNKMVKEASSFSSLVAKTSGKVTSIGNNNQPLFITKTKENSELVKYYCCSMCAYKTFRNFNLKKHIRLIHKGAKMIEILCQEEVHSTHDLAQKVESSILNYIPNESKNMESTQSYNETSYYEKDEYIDKNDERVNFSGASLENVTAFTNDIQQQQQGDLDFNKMSCSDEIIESEEQSNFYCDSKRMKVYKCLFCPKVTRGWNHYILHRKMHFSAVISKKHKCKYCTYCSSSSKFLKKHELLHKEELESGSRVQKASVPGNMKTFAGTTSPCKSSQYSGIPPDYKVKSGYQCESCPFRAKDLKTFYVHKNLHKPKETKYKCQRCTYGVDCVSKLKVHSKVHTVEYLLANYRSINSKENKDVNRVVQDVLESQVVCGSITEACNDRNRQEEVEDSMEVARTKHQLVASKKASSNAQMNLFTENWLNKNVPASDSISEESLAKEIAEGNVLKQNNIPLPPTFETTKDGDKTNNLLKSFNAKIETWHCERCPFVGNDAESLQRHISMHINKRSFECLFCNYSAPTYFYVLEHLKLHQMSNPNLLFAQSANNLQYLEANENSPATLKHGNENLYENSPEFSLVLVKIFRCTYCPFSSKMRQFLVQHLKGHMSQFEHKCPFCTFSSETPSEIRRHCQVHFSLPGSELNDHSASSLDVSSDGKVMSGEEFTHAFMENIHSQFKLNTNDPPRILGDVQVKDEAMDEYWDENAAVSLKEVCDAGHTDKQSVDLLSSSIHSSCNKDLNESKIQGHLDEKLDSSVVPPSSKTKDQKMDEPQNNKEGCNFMDQETSVDDSAPTYISKVLKDDEEDEYIEIDTTEEPENCEDTSLNVSKSEEKEHDNFRHASEETTKVLCIQNFSCLDPPWICKYCSRSLKCMQSLIQHETAHLAPCSYLQVLNPLVKQDPVPA